MSDSTTATASAAAPAPTPAEPPAAPPTPNLPAVREMSFLDMFQTDPDAEDNGVWVTWGRTRVRVRSLGAPDIQAIYERQRKAQEKIRRANDGTLPAFVVEQNDIAVSVALVTGWENMPNPDDRGRTMIPYSVDAARALLARRDMRNFRAAIYSEAMAQDNFRAATRKDLEGN